MPTPRGEPCGAVIMAAMMPACAQGHGQGGWEGGGEEAGGIEDKDGGDRKQGLGGRRLLPSAVAAARAGMCTAYQKSHEPGIFKAAGSRRRSRLSAPWIKRA
eukprot:359270-Chlamydomonas_euryale.AAC.7